MQLNQRARQYLKAYVNGLAEAYGVDDTSK